MYIFFEQMAAFMVIFPFSVIWSFKHQQSQRASSQTPKDISHIDDH